MKKDINMFVAVAKNSQAQVALTSSLYYHVKKVSAIKQKLTFSDQLPWPDHIVWTATDDLVDGKGVDAAKLWLLSKDSPSARDVAFLQYTSGSTSTPKGVILTHGNLNHNLRTFSSALQASKDTVVVSWLPQYHDMGLIGAYLGVVFNGGTGVYMSPFSFIRDPALWIRLISKHRATHLQAPNFAYSLCARKADRLEGDPAIDLSSIRHMINGAEPIQGEAIDGFYKAFKPYGLPDGVIKPTYGLAEHTVYVCGSGQQRVWVDKVALERENQFRVTNDKNIPVKEMIGCGSPSQKDHGIDLRIVNAETGEECPEGQTGEIWISSASKAQGYFGPEMEGLSNEVFHARIRSTGGEPSKHTYVKTGDYGVLYQQELFICGRMKDLIIIRGRNHYPQDIEATAESHEELRPGCSAAFSFSDGDEDEEKLALIAELRDAEIKNKASLCGKIRSAVAKEHGVKVTLIVLLKPRSIPKTTSGKISRARCKKALEDKQLDVLYRNEDIIGDAPDADEVADVEMDRNVGGTTEGQNNAGPHPRAANKETGLPTVITGEAPDLVYDYLLAELAQLLNVEQRVVNPNKPLQELGMDSMALTQLQGIITQKYQVQVPEEVLYNETTTLASLNATLCGDTNAPAATGGQQRNLIDGNGGGKKPKLFCGCIAC
uniref:Carrier domain-containing protein n=1 Tax=Globisporangium ultimum (strain ATCC 200006 / CBS 805.95 / DAOM BR144) TaxID=431595 RepID=K3WAG1_GLOUD